MFVAGQCCVVRVGLDECLVRPQISLVAPSTVEELRRVVLVLKGSLLHAALVSMLLIFGSPPRWCNVKTVIFSAVISVFDCYFSEVIFVG